MVIRYQFANGEISEVETEEWVGCELAKLDRQEYNSNRKETRRHVSLDWLADDFGMEYESKWNMEDEMLKRHVWATISALPVDSFMLIKRVYFDGLSRVEIAREDGISYDTVMYRLNKLRNELKKTL